YDDERPIISAVYHNRLKKGMKLQADPTIQYIIEDGPRRLLNKDLKMDSPYNTYLYNGLPLGPINSPGYKSLQAALYPADNNYLYFVAKGDGYHTFSNTEREHKRAKRAFQKVRHKVHRKQRSK
ncbi:MAG TPA: endolytic transglycosylase MltG, partial [Candidatus Marinimicrobia bacterium]|nr:endolytic transglycosylase MltG [Candidatus Neomarinimicrobiota bacterium]